MLKTELEINNDNLKDTIEKDILNRNSKLINLSKLLSNLNENLFISIDGRWGSGKTFFVKQFEYLVNNVDLLKKNIISDDDKVFFRNLKETNLVVYYNAWENDYHTNVFESIIYNILDKYPNLKNQSHNFKDVRNIIGAFIRDFILHSSKGLFDIDNLNKMENFESLSKNIKTIEERIDDFNVLIDELLGNKQRLILIVDELDRCKPTFAVEVLEVLKHFYSNNKITIIVSTNNLELSNTIRKYYGNGFDGYGYLNKFYDFIISLDIQDIKLYIQRKYHKLIDTHIFDDMSYLVMDYFNFSLRECNKYMIIYNILDNYFKKQYSFNKNINYVYTSVFLPLALGLKIDDVNRYDKFINKQGKDIINDFLNKKVVGTKQESHLKHLINVKETDDYKEIILNTYDNMFNNNDFYNKYPFMDAISMLGTDIIINNEK